MDTDAERRDLETLIHEELTRLPEKYRAPIVLCYLEGLTHEGAADQLGWPVGTVRGRLSRARDLLRARLTRRGVTASAALAAMGALPSTARAAVPAALRDATVRSAIQADGRPGNHGRGLRSGRGLGRRRCLRCRRHASLEDGRGVDPLCRSHRNRYGPGDGRVDPLPQQPPRSQPQAPADPREANRREMLQLKGTWTSMQTIENRTLGGVPQPPKPFKLIWSIDRDTITTSDEDGFAAGTYRFTVDPARTPKTIDLDIAQSRPDAVGHLRDRG